MNARREHLHPEGIEDFWHRRENIHFDGTTIPSFAKVDRSHGFAALHVLRHILRQLTRSRRTCWSWRVDFWILAGNGRGIGPYGANGAPYIRPSCEPYKRSPFALLTNGSTADARGR